MPVNAELTDTLVELDSLRRRDSRRRFENEALLRAVRLLAAHMDSYGSAGRILTTIHQAVAARATVLMCGHEGSAKLIAVEPDDASDLQWTERQILFGFGPNHARLVGDLSRVSGWRLENDHEAFAGASLVGIGFAVWSTPYVLACYRDFSPEFCRFDRQLFEGLALLLNQALVREADLDFRERLVAESQKNRKLEALGALAGGVAHEINTPLQYVSDNLRFLSEGFTNLLELVDIVRNTAERHRNDDLVAAIAAAVRKADLEFLRQELRQTFDQTRDGVAQIGQTVQAIKAFSHPGETGKVPLDLNETIQMIVTMTRNQWKYIADLSTELDPDLPSVPCMADDVRQVILNLLLNATQSIAEWQETQGDRGKGRITIRSRRKGDQAIVEVEDTGTGIPEAIADKIFDPFFTTKAAGHGSGQGLALCHSVVAQQHAGHISFTTEIGAGSCFRVELPILTNRPCDDPADRKAG